MGDRPHPSVFMTDSQYESYRNSGGISDVTIEGGILNYGFDADEELLIEQYSGVPEDLSDRIIEVAMEQHPGELPDREAALEYFDDRLDAGAWVTVVDGEILEEGEFHPYRVHVKTH